MLRRFVALLLVIFAWFPASAAAQGVYAPPTPIDTSQFATVAQLATTNVSMTTAQANISILQTAAACKWTYVAGTNVTIANTTTETSIATTPQQGSLTIPACATTGAYVIQVHVDGNYQAATVGPGTLTQNIKFNGTTICRVVLGNLATTGATGLGAHGNAFIRVTSTGATSCTGFLGYQITGTTEAPGYWSTVGTPTITPGSAVTLDYTGQWSVQNAANSITATAVIGSIQR